MKSFFLDFHLLVSSKLVNHVKNDFDSYRMIKIVNDLTLNDEFFLDVSIADNKKYVLTNDFICINEHLYPYISKLQT